MAPLLHVSGQGMEPIRYEIELLGRLRVRCNGQVLAESPGGKVGALLGYLAYFKVRRHHRDTLASWLWPEASGEAAHGSLRVALFRLRKLLAPEGGEGPLELGRTWVGLPSAVIVTDVERFEEAIARSDDARAISLYSSALLARYNQEWVLAERQRLEALYLGALERHGGTLARRGELEEGVALLRQGLTLDGLHEGLQRQLIRVLTAARRITAARRQWDEWERHHRAVTGQPLPGSFEQLLEGALPSSLPSAPLPRFFGREQERTVLTGLLDDDEVRLVTLVGPGGCGKTRLTLELIRELGGRACWVSLAEHAPDTSLAEATLAALEVPTVSALAPLLQVIRLFQERTAPLLVLDNLEHLEPGGLHAFLGALLRECPTLTILGTSRHRLGLTGERLYLLEPLPTPQAGDSPAQSAAAPSVALFLDRARLAQPGLRLGEEQLESIGAICRALDGLPLAIEMAASRSSVLSPAEILTRMGQRLEFLVSRNKDVPERHLSLRAALEWSFGLLSTEARHFLSQLCILRGPWSLECAEAVTGCADALDLVSELLDASLIQPETVTTQGERSRRYRLLETVRELGGAALTPEERDRLQGKLAAFFLEMVRESDRVHRGDDSWATSLAPEQGNLTVALEWCLATPEATRDGLELAFLTRAYWSRRGGGTQGLNFLSAFLWRAQNEGIADRLVFDALTSAATSATTMGDIEKARGFIDEARRLADQLDQIDLKLRVAANTWQWAFTQGSLKEAIEAIQPLLEWHRQQNPPSPSMAHALLNLAMAYTGDERWHLVESTARECLEVAERQGWTRGAAGSRYYLAIVARERGDNESARALLDEAATALTAMGEVQGMVRIHTARADWLCRDGAYGDAWKLLKATLVALGAYDFLLRLGCLVGLVEAAIPEKPVEALRLLRYAQRLVRDHGMVPTPAERKREDRLQERIRTAISPERWERLQHEEVHFSLERLLEEAAPHSANEAI